MITHDIANEYIGLNKSYFSMKLEASVKNESYWAESVKTVREKFQPNGALMSIAKSWTQSDVSKILSVLVQAAFCQAKWA